MSLSSETNTKQVKCRKTVTFSNCGKESKSPATRNRKELRRIDTPFPKPITKCQPIPVNYDSEENCQNLGKKASTVEEFVQTDQPNDDVIRNLEKEIDSASSETLKSYNSHEYTRKNKTVQTCAESNSILLPSTSDCARHLIAHSLDYGVQQGILEQKGNSFIWKSFEQAQAEKCPELLEYNAKAQQLDDTSNLHSLWRCKSKIFPKNLLANIWTRAKSIAANETDSMKTSPFLKPRSENSKTCSRKDDADSCKNRDSIRHDDGDSNLQDYEDKKIYTIKPYVPKTQKRQKIHHSHFKHIDQKYNKPEDYRELYKSFKKFVSHKPHIGKGKFVEDKPERIKKIPKYSNIYDKMPPLFKRTKENEVHNKKRKVNEQTTTKQSVISSSSSSLSDVPITKLFKKKVKLKKKRIDSPKSLYSLRSFLSSMESLTNYQPVRHHHTRNPKLNFAQEKTCGMLQRKGNNEGRCTCAKLSVKRKRAINDNKRKRYILLSLLYYYFSLICISEFIFSNVLCKIQNRYLLNLKEIR